jgi:hypothetical protein
VLENHLRTAPSGASGAAQRILAQPRSASRHRAAAPKLADDAALIRPTAEPSTTPLKQLQPIITKSFLFLFFKKAMLASAFHLRAS